MSTGMFAQHTGVAGQTQNSESPLAVMEPQKFAKAACPGDNLGMAKRSFGVPETRSKKEPFSPGAVVIATMCNPREKFWGIILALAAEGISLSGAELASFEDLAVMVRDGDPFSPAVVFFPTHRIERVELDLPDGGLPSLSQRFKSKTGLDPAVALAPPRQDQQETTSDRASQTPPSQERA